MESPIMFGTTRVWPCTVKGKRRENELLGRNRHPITLLSAGSFVQSLKLQNT